MAIYSRSDWGARPPKYQNNMKAFNGIFIHHSAGPITQTVTSIQNYHMDNKGWSDIAYSWLVDDKGNIYEGRGWGIAGGHTKNYNFTSHAICYIGNTQVSDATDAAKRSINLLIAEYENKYSEGFVTPHRDAAGAATACPGAGLVAWVEGGRVTAGNTAPPALIIGDGVNDVIGRGDTGVSVAAFQLLLVNQDYVLTIDGEFGSKTESATLDFQQVLTDAEFTPGDVDGIWGPASNLAYMKQEVTVLYEELLKRTPAVDDEGLAFWAEQATIIGLPAVAGKIMESDEYIELNAPAPPPPPPPPVEPPPVVEPPIEPPAPVESPCDCDCACVASPELVDQVIAELVQRFQ